MLTKQRRGKRRKWRPTKPEPAPPGARFESVADYLARGGTIRKVEPADLRPPRRPFFGRFAKMRG